MSTTTKYVDKINGKDIYAARAVATQSGVNIDAALNSEITANDVETAWNSWSEGV